MTNPNKLLSALILATLPALGLAAGEHGAHGAMHTEAPVSAGHDAVAGAPGDPAKVSRTISVEMSDTMRFTPDQVQVKAGETVRFFVVNKGQVPHEMVIGTLAELDEHAEMMRKMPGMVHKEPNQIALAPGQRGGIVWTFSKAGTVSYACMIPGHKEAGMVGAVTVQ
jgi:uncharacterized cupredoxin-like copper-binding protein